MATIDDVIEVLRACVRIDEPVDAMTPLLSSGLVDSLGLATLIGAIEDEFAVAVDESLVGVDTFDTPAQILEFVSSSPRAG